MLTTCVCSRVLFGSSEMRRVSASICLSSIFFSAYASAAKASARLLSLWIFRICSLIAIIESAPSFCSL